MAETVTKKPAKKKAATKKKVAAKPKVKKITLTQEELDPLQEADEILGEIELLEEECRRKSLRVDSCKDELKNARGEYLDAVDRLRQLCRTRKEHLPLFDKKEEKKKVEQPASTPTGKPAALPVVTICAGSDLHGIANGTEVFVEFIKPGGVIVSGADINPTALSDDEYTATDEVANLIDGARAAGIFSDGDKWRDFLDTQNLPAKDKPKAKNDDWRKEPLEAAEIDGQAGKLLWDAGYDTLGKLSDLMAEKGQWWTAIPSLAFGESMAAQVADAFADFWAKHPEYCEGGKA